MSASDPSQVAGSSSPTPTPDDANNVYWADMNAVLQQKHVDAVQDDTYEEQLSQEEVTRMQNVLNSENNVNATGDGVLSLLKDTPPSPMGLVGGASAPSTSTTVSKMTNNINQV